MRCLLEDLALPQPGECTPPTLTDAQPFKGVDAPQLGAERLAGRQLLLPRLAQHSAQRGLRRLCPQQPLQQLLLPALLLLGVVAGRAAAVAAGCGRPQLQLLQAQLCHLGAAALHLGLRRPQPLQPAFLLLQQRCSRARVVWTTEVTF